MNLFYRILSGLTENGRDSFVNVAAAGLAPLAAEYRTIPSPSEASRRAMRNAINSLKKEC